MRWARVAMSLAGALWAAGSVSELPAADPKPLPIERTQILHGDDAIYFVEGRRKIPKGVEISIQKGIKVVGRGEGAAIVVEGSLQVHGVRKLECVFADLVIEPAAKFEEIHLDMVVFGGKGGGVMTGKDAPCDGRLFIENTIVKAPCLIDVSMSGNQVDVQRVNCDTPLCLRGVDPKSGPNSVKAMVMTSYPQSGGNWALEGGLLVENVADVTVRNNVIAGNACVVTDCDSVTFDANKVSSKTLEFRQSAAGRFGRTRMQKCDLYTGKIVLFAPPVKGRAESLYCDKCWFQAGIDEKTLREEVFQDAEDDPASGVTVDFKKIMEKPLGLCDGK